MLADLLFRLMLFSALAEKARTAKILALMTVPSHSHHLWNVKYLKALAERGHEITYFSVDEYKNPPRNIKNIFVENFYEITGKDFKLADSSEYGPYQNTLLLHLYEDMEAVLVSRSRALRTLNETIRKEKFDLVVHDVGSGPYLLGAVDVLGRPPVVGITPFGVPTWALQILGNPVTYSSEPHFFATYSHKMNFFQRTNNYFLHLFSFAVRWFFMRKQNQYSRECFGNDVRPLRRILNDINVIMVNSNVGLDYPFPAVPGLVPVGGLHIESPKPLSQELTSYLNEAKNGVVYFSLGSNLNSSSLEKDKVDVLLETFKRLSPVRVLWKWESEHLSKMPENVKTEKWLPQNDILAHPNVALFFTHSGLLSTQEAIYHGKPVVAMPFFLDQRVNAQKCKERGLGETLFYSSLTVDAAVRTIEKVLFDPRYGENARRASLLFRDQMDEPMKRAVYWTEYAVRHEGAPHLRHAARNLLWYQSNMSDVLTFLLCLLFFAFFSIKKLYPMFISFPKIHRKKEN